MKVVIPNEKVCQVLQFATEWRYKEVATRKEYQQLAGKLQYISSCVQGGRRFMSRILAALRSTPSVGKYNIPSEILGDIAWFEDYAYNLNGVVLIPPPIKEIFVIECDSSKKGGGAFTSTHYFSEAYADDYLVQVDNIAHFEAINLVIALEHLAPPDAYRYTLVVNTDNMASRDVLDTGKGSDPILTACARKVWFLAAKMSTDVKIVYKPGPTLVLADALSRAHQSRKSREKAQELIQIKSLSRVRVPHLLSNIC